MFCLANDVVSDAYQHDAENDRIKRDLYAMDGIADEQQAQAAANIAHAEASIGLGDREKQQQQQDVPDAGK